MKKYKLIGHQDTRSGFGAGIVEAARANPNIVALCADLTGSLKLKEFQKEFPERFYQVGIAEANMMGIAAGMTIGGKIPFASTFANFATARVFDQVRQSIAYSHKNVKICASHAGLSLGEDGATHQILEDIGMMKMLPNFVVIHPCDYHQTKAATLAIARHEGPVYLRFGRPKVPIFTPEDQEFVIGKAQVLQTGKDISLFATGHMVWPALEAAQILKEKEVSAEVINIHTIKPLDEKAIVRSVKKTACALSIEEHQVSGGLGESIGRILIQQLPVPMEMMGVQDQFGESGKPDELLKKYGLSTENIVESALKVIKQK